MSSEARSPVVATPRRRGPHLAWIVAAVTFLTLLVFLPLVALPAEGPGRRWSAAGFLRTLLGDYLAAFLSAAARCAVAALITQGIRRPAVVPA